MQTVTSQPAVEFGESSLSVQDFLKDLHVRGQLRPLLEQTAVQHYVASQAASHGLTISTEELQAAADTFRRLCGLTSAERTHAWLTEKGLSVDEFEASLERKLAIRKLKSRFTDDDVAERFKSHEGDYARAQLRQILVEREDLAKELLSQIRDDGRDFGELAASHSIHASAPRGGALGVLFRAQLPAATGQAVFNAPEGSIVGPIATPDGFCLLRVERLLPPTLDEPTGSLIREQLFQQWVAKLLAERPLRFPLLDTLRASA
jgi:hypothetical protein